MGFEPGLNSGIFSHYPDGSLAREFAPFNQQLAVDFLASDLNSGRISVAQAYRHFWSKPFDLSDAHIPLSADIRLLEESARPILEDLASSVDTLIADEIIQVGNSALYRARACRREWTLGIHRALKTGELTFQDYSKKYPPADLNPFIAYLEPFYSDAHFFHKFASISLASKKSREFAKSTINIWTGTVWY